MKNRIHHVLTMSSITPWLRTSFFITFMFGYALWPAAQSPPAAASETSSLTHLQPRCIIVVGAFEEKANADRKVRYLAQKGLDNLYRGMHNGKEYLGVPINCDRPNIDEYLRDFQYRYIADAWIFTLPNT